MINKYTITLITEENFSLYKIKEIVKETLDKYDVKTSVDINKET